MNIDILDVNTWDGDMFERLRWLRNNDPVHWDEKNQLHVITKYQDLVFISKNPQIFCSGEGTRPNMPTRLSIVDMDEPRHGQLRRLVNKGFSPRMVGKLETFFRAMAVEAVDRIADTGWCDFVASVSVPLPLELIAELIGIDKRDRDKFHRWSNEMIASDGRYDDPVVMQRATQAFADYVTHLQHAIAERRAMPRDDLMSVLVNAKAGELLGSDTSKFAADVRDKLSEEAIDMAGDEMLMFLVMLMVAGNETTRNAITGGISALIENPLERLKLIENPALIPLAADEIVRYVSPVLNFARTATQDTEVRGKAIRKGEKVLLCYPSANRDEDIFEESERFIADRDPNPHVGFGIGNHFCLGASLARMEIRVVLEEVLSRIPDLEYADGPPKLHLSTLVRGFASMPVRFTPERYSAAKATA